MFWGFVSQRKTEIKTFRKFVDTKFLMCSPLRIFRTQLFQLLQEKSKSLLKENKDTGFSRALVSVAAKTKYREDVKEKLCASCISNNTLFQLLSLTARIGLTHYPHTLPHPPTHSHTPHLPPPTHTFKTPNEHNEILDTGTSGNESFDLWVSEWDSVNGIHGSWAARRTICSWQCKECVARYKCFFHLAIHSHNKQLWYTVATVIIITHPTVAAQVFTGIFFLVGQGARVSFTFPSKDITSSSGVCGCFLSTVP